MLLAAAALFVVSLGYGVIVPLLPSLAAGASSAGLLSIVYALYSTTKVAVQIPGGVWADRAGAGRVLQIALMLFTLSLGGFLVPGGVSWFALVRAVEGAATGLVYPAVCALVVSSASPSEAGRRIGLTVGVGSSGLLIGPALAGLLSGWGARVPILVALVASAGVTAASLLGRASARPEVARRIGTEVRYVLALAGDLAFLGLLLPIAFNKLTFSAFQPLLPLVGGDRLALPLGISAGGLYSVTGLFALTGVCFALAQVGGGWLADRFAPRRVILALTPPLLGALWLLSGADRPSSFTAIYAAYVAISSGIFVAAMKHAARVFGTNDTYGRVFGVVATITDLATILGPLLFLNLYAVAGARVFTGMALVGLPFALGFWVLSADR